MVLKVVFVVLFIATCGGAHAIWWFALRPARFHQGESGIKPDRYGDFLSAEWYLPAARPWLIAARWLWGAGLVFFMVGFITLVKDS